MSFDCQELLCGYRWDSWTMRQFEDSELLGDPRGSRRAFQAYTNPYLEHMMVFIYQRDPLSGMDSCQVFKMDLRYNVETRELTSKAKLMIRKDTDLNGRSGAGYSLGT